MFDLNFGENGTNDDNLILSDPIVMNVNTLKLAPDYLNKEISKMEQRKQKQLRNKVRYETDGRNTIFILYSLSNDDEMDEDSAKEDIHFNKYGLFNKR